jgi:hypothetical protein
VTLGHSRSIAERLGLPQEAVRSVQRRGFLRRRGDAAAELEQIELTRPASNP